MTGTLVEIPAGLHWRLPGVLTWRWC